MKNHGLIGMDIIKINATNLVNNVKPIIQGQLVNYKANILKKSGRQPSYFESPPLPFHIQPIVKEKLLL